MRKVLLLDDDEALRRLMRLELSDAFEIIDSGDPAQGLALALEHKPDAILLDLRMPNYSGYELLQTFTALSHTQKIPVVIVSGEAGAQTKEHCKQLGAAGYFEKPIDFDALRACLRQIARYGRYTPRAEVRVRLHVALKLGGVDGQGKKFEAIATTENVSLSGFVCSCTADLPLDSILDIYLTSSGENYVGKAKIVHLSSNGPPLRQYGCLFIQKTGPWVLQ